MQVKGTVWPHLTESFPRWRLSKNHHDEEDSYEEECIWFACGAARPFDCGGRVGRGTGWEIFHQESGAAFLENGGDDRGEGHGRGDRPEDPDGPAERAGGELRHRQGRARGEEPGEGECGRRGEIHLLRVPLGARAEKGRGVSGVGRERRDGPLEAGGEAGGGRRERNE